MLHKYKVCVIIMDITRNKWPLPSNVFYIGQDNRWYWLDVSKFRYRKARRGTKSGRQTQYGIIVTHYNKFDIYCLTVLWQINQDIIVYAYFWMESDFNIKMVWWTGWLLPATLTFPSHNSRYSLCIVCLLASTKKDVDSTPAFTCFDCHFNI